MVAVNEKTSQMVISVTGSVEKVVSNHLTNPDRIVVELFGAKNGSKSNSVPINALNVSSVQFEEFPDRLQMTILSSGGALPNVGVVKVPEGFALQF